MDRLFMSSKDEACESVPMTTNVTTQSGDLPSCASQGMFSKSPTGGCNDHFQKAKDGDNFSF